MKKYSFLSIVLFLVYLQVNAQETNKTIQQGNDFYKQKQYDKAEASYKEVLDQDQSNTTARFNRANAMIRQDKQADAIKELDDLSANSSEAELKGKSFYNKGVVLSGQKKLEESIEAYKGALRQNPNDKEARENLQKALVELRKRTPPPPPKKDNKKKNEKQQPKKQQQQPKMNEKEAEQRLKLLEQKEKDLQQRLQKQKSTTGGGQPKDW